MISSDHIKATDSLGKEYGRLTCQLVYMHRNNSGVTRWRGGFICSCGKTKDTQLRNVVLGRTQSCGCLATEKQKNNLESYKESQFLSGKFITLNATGLSKKAAAAFRNMWRRCSDPANASFDRYGGRGISVCKEWEDFGTFISDMGYPPSEDMSIERVDNSKGYSKDNCVWIPRTLQSRNTRQNVEFTLNGGRILLTDLYRLTGKRNQSYYYALSKGISALEFFNLPGLEEISNGD
jgi:hypothetical protein